MLEFFISQGTWLYIASWSQNGFFVEESGWSVIVLGLGIAWIDDPYNPFRREWCFPRNAWDGKHAG